MQSLGRHSRSFGFGWAVLPLLLGACGVDDAALLDELSESDSQAQGEDTAFRDGWGGLGGINLSGTTGTLDPGTLDPGGSGTAPTAPAMIVRQGKRQQGIRQQGLELAGHTIAGFDFAGARVPKRAISNLHVEAGELVGTVKKMGIQGIMGQTMTLRGTGFTNATIWATALEDATGLSKQVEFRIAQVVSVKDVAAACPLGGPGCLSTEWHPKMTTDWSGGVYLYRVEQKVTAVDGTQSWQPACVETAVEPAYADWALVVGALWNPHGDREESSTQFTFACLSGAIAKCAKWGYGPWEGAEIARFHQTCTRMARADYCGNGQPHTEDGTEINLWDVQLDPAVQGHATVDNHVGEAVWGPNGAYCILAERMNPNPGPNDPYNVPTLCEGGMNGYGFSMRGCSSVPEIHGFTAYDQRIANSVRKGTPFHPQPVDMFVGGNSGVLAP